MSTGRASLTWDLSLLSAIPAFAGFFEDDFVSLISGFEHVGVPAFRPAPLRAVE
jgi:hypothetical protein